MPHSASLKSHTVAEQSSKIPSLSLGESLYYNVAHVIPAYMRGLFTPNRFWTTFWTRFEPDPAAVKFIGKMRKKYGSNYLYLRLLTKKSLLVLDQKGIKHVLDNSPDIYADAKLKRVGMSHFQPDSLTLSRGEAWRERRIFNEDVLDSGHSLHRFADAFLDIISGETALTLQQAQGKLVWDDFAHLFERITLQIVFGKGEKDTALLRALRQMMRESNRAFALRKSGYFDPFYTSLSKHRQRAAQQSLAGLCPHAAAARESTKVDNQIPHWLFAMADTLAINCARTLALIVSHHNAERRVRDDMAQTNIDSVDGIDDLHYLEGCVQEAMRLWPTTPTLVREILRDDRIDEITVIAGTQVIINNSFNHRDGDSVKYADSFAPQAWLTGAADYRFNHLSNGRQGCAGKALALFIAKAVLAHLLAGHRYILEAPALDSDKPLPYLYNHFKLRLALRNV